MKLAAQSFVGVFIIFFSGASTLAVCIHTTEEYDIGHFRTVMLLKYISIYYKRTTMMHSSQCPAIEEGINML